VAQRSSSARLFFPISLSQVTQYKTAIIAIRCKIKTMSYITEHLSSLRQEITVLRTMNARYSEQSEHGPMDQSALELRANRLLEIKQELSKILDRPNDSGVWWEKFRGPGRAA
jgi:hypothetical protein